MTDKPKYRMVTMPWGAFLWRWKVVETAVIYDGLTINRSVTREIARGWSISQRHAKMKAVRAIDWAVK